MSQLPRLTSIQRTILAVVAGHPEAVHFRQIQELELLGYLGGEGPRLEVTELGKLALGISLGQLPGERAGSSPH